MQAAWKKRNPEKSKEHNIKKNKTYREKLKHFLTPAEEADQRRKNSERQRLCRLKKNENLPQEELTLFKSPQIRGKLIKKARTALTGSKEQNQNILKMLMTESSTQESFLGTSSTTGYRLSQNAKDRIEQFFFDDEISRSSPNAASAVILLKSSNVASKTLLSQLTMAKHQFHSSLSPFTIEE